VGDHEPRTSFRGSRIMLQAQSVRELNLWQTRHEFAEKSSKSSPWAHHFSPIKMHVFEEHLETGVCGRSPCKLPCNPCRRPSTKLSCAFSSLGRHGYIDCSGCRIVSGMFRSAEHGQKDWIPLAKLLNRLSRPRVVKNDRRFITAWFATNKRKSESHCRFPRAAIFAQC
jgi:hypothetical protein